MDNEKIENKDKAVVIEITEWDMRIIKSLHYTCKFKAVFEKDPAYKSVLQICLPMEAIAILNNQTPTDPAFMKVLYILNERFYAFINYVLEDAGVFGEFNNGDNRGYIIKKIEDYVKSLGYPHIQGMLNDYIENNLVYDVMLIRKKKSLQGGC